MHKLNCIKNYIFLSLILIILFAPTANIFADSVSDALNAASIASYWFLGPTALPVGVAITGLQYLTGTTPTATGSITEPASYVLGGIAQFVNWLFRVLSLALLTIGQGMLDFSINIKLPGATDLINNTVVAEGWNAVRNLANAALVIGLVVIAINIILGNEENKAKKTLINFILIALLINFTPVICGVIIDASDIIMRSFLTGGINNNYVNAISSAFDGANSALKPDPIKLLTVTIILLVFSLVFFVICILYALLFLARHLVLWILVIASPIAFATKVFPKSKYVKMVFPSILYWDEWWKQFIQWCVIGIPAGLFIYLANKIMTGSPSIITVASTGNVAENWVTATTAFLFMYSTPFIFLLVGFFITISTASEAAKDISPELTKMVKGAAGFAGKAAIGVGGGMVGGVVGALAIDKEAQEKAAAEGKSYGRFDSMMAGYNRGKEKIQKEGVFGSTIDMGGKIMGGTIGAGVGAKDWMLRDRNKKEEDFIETDGLPPKWAENATYDAQTHKWRYENTKKKSDKLSAYILTGARKGLKKGTAATVAEGIANPIGEIAGGLGGAAAGIMVGAATGAIKERSIAGIMTGAGTTGTKWGEGGAKFGKATAEEATKRVGNAATDAVKRTGNTVFSEMEKAAITVPKDKTYTEKGWKKKEAEDKFGEPEKKEESKT